MPHLHVITSDEKLIAQYYGFQQASRDAFTGDDDQRFKAILTAQEYRKQLLDRLMDIKGLNSANIIDQSLIDSKDNDQSVIERLAALMLDKAGLKAFVKQNQDKLSKEMFSLLNEVMRSIQDNQHVLFWMVGEDEIDDYI
jgi:hypothetical protein